MDTMNDQEILDLVEAYRAQQDMDNRDLLAANARLRDALRGIEAALTQTRRYAERQSHGGA